jgi:hypothetical protein
MAPAGIWFQGNHHGGNMAHGEAAQSLMLQTLDSFLPSQSLASTKDMLTSTNLRYSFITSIKHMNFYLAFGTPFGGKVFTK